VSRWVAYLLRHNGGRAHRDYDGWIEISLLNTLADKRGFDRAEVHDVLHHSFHENRKRYRYQLASDCRGLTHVRACWGF
jgi:RNA:NAD 2'-phosphotransferase (TPT1/KptA family)